jgi:hypothetical protein
MTTHCPLVWIVEDQELDRRLLRQGLLSAGIPDAEILESRTYDEAWARFEHVLRETRQQDTRRRHSRVERRSTDVYDDAENALRPHNERKNTLLPLVIIADVGLQHEVENGVALLGNVFRKSVTETAAGLWTIAVTAHPLDRIGEEKPHIPHVLLQKDIGGRHWGRTIGRLVAPLVAPALPTDAAANDFAPTSGVTPGERIYLYERGDATYANVDLGGVQFADCFDLGLIQPRLRELRAAPHPILMYRGRYIELQKHSFQKLLRVLVRTRAALRRRGRDICAAEVMSYDGRGNLEDTSASRGIPAASLGNFFSWLRGVPEVRTLLEDIYMRPLDELLPIVHRREPGWTPPSEVFVFRGGVASIRDGWVPGPVVRCPADLSVGGCRNGFFSELQFVLTEAEVVNYREWKTTWSQQDGVWESLR